MNDRDLLNRLVKAMIDWQADMRHDVVAHYHRSPMLDRLRRQCLVNMTMRHMVRMMLKARVEDGIADNWREMLTVLEADWRAINADIDKETPPLTINQMLIV
jgi:hypothetical protein